MKEIYNERNKDINCLKEDYAYGVNLVYFKLLR